MRTFSILFCFLFFVPKAFCQDNENSSLLKTILNTYYKKEKPAYKGRSQLLYLYCNQANNSEEIFEAIQNQKLPDVFLKEIRTKINTDVTERSWDSELKFLFEKDATQLKIKVNECLSLERYQEISQRLHLNNQRLMIISKPLYYLQSKIALVKVVFFRNIEHNNGAVLLLEKQGNEWVIKEYLNPWST